MIALDILQAALKPELQRQMAEIGMDCTAIRVTVLFEALAKESFYCVDCASRNSKTMDAVFTQRTSFFFTRTETTSRGYFCGPCALSVAFKYNLVMMVCGWWGIIGSFMTPVLIVMNWANAITVVCAAKTPELHAALSLEKMKSIAEKGR